MLFLKFNAIDIQKKLIKTVEYVNLSALFSIGKDSTEKTDSNETILISLSDDHLNEKHSSFYFFATIVSRIEITLLRSISPLYPLICNIRQR